jgi:hypothetical protein
MSPNAGDVDFSIVDARRGHGKAGRGEVVAGVEAPRQTGPA